MFSSNIVLPAAFSTTAVLYGSPSGGSTGAQAGSGAPFLSAVLPVPTACTVQGLAVTVFKPSGATGSSGTATVSLAIGTAAQVQAGATGATGLPASAVACTVVAPGAFPVSCSTTATVALTPSQFISIQTSFPGGATFAFGSTNFLVSFVCR